MSVLRRLGRGLWSALQRRLVHEGSTRAVALMRIGLAALAWSEYAHSFRGHVDLNTTRIVIGLLFYVFSTLMFLGVLSRLSTFCTGLTLFISYYELGYHGYRSEFLHYHTYAMNTLIIVLALTPCGRSYSLDRWRSLRNAVGHGAPPAAECGPLWAVPLLSLQVSMVYLGGAYDKANALFLSGGRLQQIYSLYFGSHEGVSIPYFFELMTIMAWATVCLELALAVGLFVPRLQSVLIPAGIAFHALIYWSMPVSTFSLMMVLVYLSFIPEQSVDGFLRIMDGSRTDHGS
jgi:hypothetical protein